MGIKDLLKIFRPVARKINLSKYKGKKIAIDSFVILHKYAINWAKEVVEENSKNLINSCLNAIESWVSLGIIPVMVFDGRELPMKKKTNQNREKKRSEALKNAIQATKEGDHKKARSEYIKAISITPKIVHNFIEELQKKKIEVIVAPYEADAQLTYLYLNNYCSAVLTIDSDLLVYGVENCIFDCDKDGNGYEMSWKDIYKVNQDGNLNQLENQLENLNLNENENENENEKNSSTKIIFDFSGWTYEMFLKMVILSGCDYLKSIKGIGLKRAFNLVSKFEKMEKIYQEIEKKKQIPLDYKTNFQNAFLTFLHQRVYDPIKKEMVFLRPFDPKLELDLDVSKLKNSNFLGEFLKSEIVEGIAKGKLNPRTLKEF
ncbi:exonuclease [Anaeramoeba ignava]|uniref:Exonuclease n=1 Tax=Anaeramoeba ignava TaxID=1746090 RepID=A0A9Q0LK42_ANAIG|nr:exonuclease [Anaeramoeba ignava]